MPTEVGMACSKSCVLAERTGLEPATPGVTGRYSNQLNYRSEEWRPYGDSNPGTHRERVMS